MTKKPTKYQIRKRKETRDFHRMLRRHKAPLVAWNRQDGGKLREVKNRKEVSNA